MARKNFRFFCRLADGRQGGLSDEQIEREIIEEDRAAMAHFGLTASG
jgi:hypothetical protein